MHEGFQEGMIDFTNGIDKIDGTPFFSLKTEYERWYFHGWQYAKGRLKYVRDILA